MNAFCETLRGTLAASGLFPLGGIRVRGHAATVQSIADGADGHLFLDMILRIGTGRSAAEKAECLDQIYAAAQRALEGPVGSAPFGLSLELRETPADTSRKRWNTLHTAVGSVQR